VFLVYVDNVSCFEVVEGFAVVVGTHCWVCVEGVAEIVAAAVDYPSFCHIPVEVLSMSIRPTKLLYNQFE